MIAMNYMRRIGHSSCIRCDFETSDDMSFAEQDKAIMDHLAEKHPDWMTDGGASILKHRLSESPADKVVRLEATIASLEARLKALEEAWRTTVGDGTDKLTPEGIRSLVDDYQEDLREMKARLKALEWRHITDDNLPEEGDEVWDAYNHRVVFPPLDRSPDAKWFRDHSYTHFRKPNAPCPACAEDQNHLRKERIKEALKFMQD